eukprot:5427123-Prymnesium_polylepis.1
MLREASKEYEETDFCATGNELLSELMHGTVSEACAFMPCSGDTALHLPRLVVLQAQDMLPHRKATVAHDRLMESIDWSFDKGTPQGECVRTRKTIQIN